mmetsp:Transcript_38698/g.75136  ORF Transcript_38698/g.75136 Transcript_38698/m.75136 type:complete len:335 (+) Transcript_38698:442-1446(+)
MHFPCIFRYRVPLPSKPLFLYTFSESTPLAFLSEAASDCRRLTKVSFFCSSSCSSSRARTLFAFSALDSSPTMNSISNGTAESANSSFISLFFVTSTLLTLVILSPTLTPASFAAPQTRRTSRLLDVSPKGVVSTRIVFFSTTPTLCPSVGTTVTCCSNTGASVSSIGSTVFWASSFSGTSGVSAVSTLASGSAPAFAVLSLASCAVSCLSSSALVSAESAPFAGAASAGSSAVFSGPSSVFSGLGVSSGSFFSFSSASTSPSSAASGDSAWASSGAFSAALGVASVTTSSDFCSTPSPSADFGGALSLSSSSSLSLITDFLRASRALLPRVPS